MILIKLYHRESDISIQNILDNVGEEFLKDNLDIYCSVQALA